MFFLRRNAIATLALGSAPHTVKGLSEPGLDIQRSFRLPHRPCGFSYKVGKENQLHSPQHMMDQLIQCKLTCPCPHVRLNHADCLWLQVPDTLQMTHIHANSGNTSHSHAKQSRDGSKARRHQTERKKEEKIAPDQDQEHPGSQILNSSCSWI